MRNTRTATNNPPPRPLHLTASGLAEVSHRTEFRGEQDGGEEAAVERLHAFAGAFLVGVSAVGEGRGGEDGGGEMKGGFGCEVRGGGVLDIDVAQHVVADVAAHVELFDASVAEHKGSEALACTAALPIALVSP